MSADYVNMSDYELGKLGYWPTFSSSTKSKAVANSFMDEDGNGVLLKIYLSAQNNPTSHIDCNGKKSVYKKNKEVSNEFSFFPGEEEVLLFPYFGFLTLKKEKLEIKNNVDLITLMEIPF